MPELPEVEIVKQSLNKKIKSSIIKKVIVRNGNLRFKIPTNFEKYGNLVSTSIPVLLKENFLKLKKNKTIIMCGFGVGLSMGMVKLVK